MSDESPLPEALRRQAEAWATKFSRTSVSSADLAAFFAWRRIPENSRVWDALAAGCRPIDRYVVRPQAERFRVVDIWTGETAVIALTPQEALSEEDARHTANLLNRRAKSGDRSIPQ